MKKYILFILIVFILTSGVAFGQVDPNTGTRQLEIDYPDVGGPTITPQDVEITIPQYIQYIYYFFLGATGVIALIVIVNAGIGYLTSAGNPSKMQDSKEKITAALLGLLILAGSYGILYTINPDLISLHIPELQPLITRLEPGVLLCKEEGMEVKEAWKLMEKYEYAANNNERRAIKDVLTPLLDEIYEACYTVRTAEDIRSDFEDQIIEIWFIPLITEDENGKIVRENSAEYGAIFYNDKGFKGESNPYVQHLLGTKGWIPFKANVVLSDISSIAPFKLIDILNPNWKVTLYEETNYNEQFTNKKTREFLAGDFANYWWELFSGLTWSPKSMETEGDLLVILEKVDNSGSYIYTTESFFGQNIANLEKYESIIEKVPCKDYVSEYSEDCVAGYGGGGSGGVVVVEQECCFKAAATEILIIGAEPL